MGLGKAKKTNGMYLSVAGGFIWNFRVDESDSDYSTQEYERSDGTIGIRKGAKYDNLTGKVVGVCFKTHDEYGESINVTVSSEGETFIVSIATNNRYSQDMMKILLKADLSKEILIDPYDFIGSDKKRVKGLSSKQDGVKLDLRVDSSPTKGKEWFKTASKREIRRFFEDLTEWYVAEVEEKVVPKLVQLACQSSSAGQDSESFIPDIGSDLFGDEDDKEGEKEESLPAVREMKKELKAYIDEHHKGKSLPQLSHEELIKWYKLSKVGGSLPFGDSTEPKKKYLEKQIDDLLG